MDKPASPPRTAAASARPESGAMQFGDDWPGVFIRGDGAFHYAAALRALLLPAAVPSALANAFVTQRVVAGLAATLESVTQRPCATVLRPYPECVLVPDAATRVGDEVSIFVRERTVTRSWDSAVARIIELAARIERLCADVAERAKLVEQGAMSATGFEEWYCKANRARQYMSEERALWHGVVGAAQYRAERERVGEAWKLVGRAERLLATLDLDDAGRRLLSDLAAAVPAWYRDTHDATDSASATPTLDAPTATNQQRGL